MTRVGCDSQKGAAEFNVEQRGFDLHNCATLDRVWQDAAGFITHLHTRRGSSDATNIELRRAIGRTLAVLGRRSGAPDSGNGDMRAQTALFSRQYRTALHDFLLGSGEAALSRAYELGRTAIDEGIGLLPILQAHQDAIQAVLQSTLPTNESLRGLMAAEDFLVEILSSFEMTYRGYVALLEGPRAPGDKRLSSRRRKDRHNRRSK